MKRVVFSLVVVLLMLTLVPGVSARPAQAEIICHHVVRPGETVYCIARAYGVDPHAIITTNALLYPNRIHPGTTLRIPNVPRTIPPGPTCVRQCPNGTPPVPPPCGDCECASYHTIAWGETLTRISLHYGVNMWTLARCNCIYNLNYIVAGRQLCIPTSD